MRSGLERQYIYYYDFEITHIETHTNIIFFLLLLRARFLHSSTLRTTILNTVDRQMLGLSEAQSKTSVRVATLVIGCIRLCIEIHRDLENTRNTVCLGVYIFCIFLAVGRVLIRTRIVRFSFGQIGLKQVVLLELFRINAGFSAVSLCV